MIDESETAAMPLGKQSQLDKNCNVHVNQALEFARQLIILADEGEGGSEDDGCMVLYGVVRDCAYKIRAEAEREREVHRVRTERD